MLAFGDNRIDPDTGTLQFYGLVDNKDGTSLPGSRSPRSPGRWQALPGAARARDVHPRRPGQAHYVLIAVEKDGKNIAERRNVTLGALSADGRRAVQLADAATQGDKPTDWWVIVDNFQRVRIDYPVEPQKPAR